MKWHREAYEFAEMGFIPAGAYRNREYAEAAVRVTGGVSRAMQDICYDPQTSGGLLFALPREDADACLAELRQAVPDAAVIGWATEAEEFPICLHA